MAAMKAAKAGDAAPRSRPRSLRRASPAPAAPATVEPRRGRARPATPEPALAAAAPAPPPDPPHEHLAETMEIPTLPEVKGTERAE